MDLPPRLGLNTKINLLTAVLFSLAVHGVAWTFVSHSSKLIGSNHFDYFNQGSGIISVEVEQRGQSTRASNRQTHENSSKNNVTPREQKLQEKLQTESQSKPAAAAASKLSDGADGVDGHGQAGLAITKWPKIVFEEKIEYPTAAKLKRVEGVVTLKLTINDLGEPTEVEVVDGPGFGLNEAAATAMKKYRFSPAFVHDQPVVSQILYKYNFKIK